MKVLDFASIIQWKNYPFFLLKKNMSINEKSVFKVFRHFYFRIRYISHVVFKTTLIVKELLSGCCKRNVVFLICLLSTLHYNHIIIFYSKCNWKANFMLFYNNVSKISSKTLIDCFLRKCWKVIFAIFSFTNSS